MHIVSSISGSVAIQAKFVMPFMIHRLNVMIGIKWQQVVITQTKCRCPNEEYSLSKI